MVSSGCAQKAACFGLVLFICVYIRHVMAERNSVCGSGSYLLDKTGLDIYLLPNTFATLQAAPSRHGSKNILWFAPSGKNGPLPSKKERKTTNLQIGPMNKELNFLCIRYAYIESGSTIPSQISNTACLHLIESDFRAFPDKSFRNGQVVHVTTGSTQRVFCYRRTPANNDTGIYAAPAHLSLIKRKDRFGFSSVGTNRYYENDSCLWMVSLQPEDAGTYRLEIADCFGSAHSTIDIDFSLLVSQSLTPSQSNYSTTQHLLLHHGTTESTTSASQMTESAVSSLAPKTTFRLPTTLSSILSQTLQLTLESGRAYDTYVNSKLTVKYHVSGRSSRQLTVTVRHNETDARRVVIHQFNLTIINVLQSDSGLYQVIARDGDRNATVNFNVNIQEAAIPPSINKTSESIRTNLSYGIITNSIGTNSTGASSTENGRGWIFVVIAPITLLIIFITAVIILFRRRDSLRRFCVRHCCCMKRKQQRPGQAYCTTDDGILMKRTFSEEEKIKTITENATQTNATEDATGDLPDVVMTAASQNIYATEELSSAVHARVKDNDTEPMPVYAIVHNEKKSFQETSHAVNAEETVPVPTSGTISKDAVGRTGGIPVYATVSRKQDKNRNCDLPTDVRLAENTPSTRGRNDNTREAPRPPAPYKDSTTNSQLHAQENNTQPGHKEAKETNTEENNVPVVYAKVKTPVPPKKPKRPVVPVYAVSAKMANKEPPIQYVELDMSAFTKKE